MSKDNDDWDNPHFVTWADNGRRVEIEEGGNVVAGNLHVTDTIYGEDNEEIPVFAVLSDDGAEHAFVLQGQWRFVFPIALE